MPSKPLQRARRTARHCIDRQSCTTAHTAANSTAASMCGRSDVSLYYIMMGINPIEQQCAQGASIALAVHKAQVRALQHACVCALAHSCLLAASLCDDVRAHHPC